MNRRWTCDEAYKWYIKYPWLRGCNFIGSDCASRIDMWQSYKSEEHFETADRELGYAQKLGFNTVRLLVEFDVWFQERESFMDILERYISLCDIHHMYVVLCLYNEAVLERGGTFTPKPLGEQKYYLGYHQGRFPLSEEEKKKTPYHPLEFAEWRTPYIEMVREIVTKYKDDPRVIVWNVCNEPGITIGERSYSLEKVLEEAVRSCDPSQPLTFDIWHKTKDGKIDERDETSFECSDVISVHMYFPLDEIKKHMEVLDTYNRPILLTEWLNRISHSGVEVYPYLQEQKIACWCWGFVVGKTQTNEPWDSLWEQYYNGTHPEYDFTKWQHDLLRPNGRPYDPHEVELIENVNALADMEWKAHR